MLCLWFNEGSTLFVYRLWLWIHAWLHVSWALLLILTNKITWVDPYDSHPKYIKWSLVFIANGANLHHHCSVRSKECKDINIIINSINIMNILYKWLGYRALLVGPTSFLFAVNVHLLWSTLNSVIVHLINQPVKSLSLLHCYIKCLRSHTQQ